MAINSMFNKPHATNRTQKVLQILGNGRDFTPFIIVVDYAELRGSVLHTDKGQEIRVMNRGKEEDFFEDIIYIEVQLITNDPNVTFDPNTKEVTYAFSAYSEHMLSNTSPIVIHKNI